MAWQPQAPVAGGEAAGGGKLAGEAAAGEAAGEAEGGGKSAELVFSRPPPPLRTFAARVPERQDRKAMWLLPPCAAGVTPLELRLPRTAGRRLRGRSNRNRNRIRNPHPHANHCRRERA